MNSPKIANRALGQYITVIWMYFLLRKKLGLLAANLVLVLDGQLWGHKMIFVSIKIWIWFRHIERFWRQRGDNVPNPFQWLRTWSVKILHQNRSPAPAATICSCSCTEFWFSSTLYFNISTFTSFPCHHYQCLISEGWDRCQKKCVAVSKLKSCF